MLFQKLTARLGPPERLVRSGQAQHRDIGDFAIAHGELEEQPKGVDHLVSLGGNQTVTWRCRGRWRSRPTRTGSSSIATSTWTICASTKKKGCAVPLDPRPFQPSTVPPRSRALRAGFAGATAKTAASLTVAARGALPVARSGRRDRRFRSNEGCCYRPGLNRHVA